MAGRVQRLRKKHNPLTASWTKEDIDEMLCELLGCTPKEAAQIRTRWMHQHLSPREEIIKLARELDEARGADGEELVKIAASLDPHCFGDAFNSDD